MRASLVLTIRLGILLAFLLSMPVLSIPQINRWVDEQYLGILKPTANSANQTVVPTIRPLSDPSQADLIPSSNFEKAAPTSGKERPGEIQPASANLASNRADRGSDADAHARFQSMQSRLQNLGAQYLVLEKWPGDQSEYRFHCRMAVPGSAAYARPFEARDADPLRAMETVLADVESWCACHSSTTSTKRR